MLTHNSLGTPQRNGNVLVLNTKKYDVKPMMTFTFAYASRRTSFLAVTRSVPMLTTIDVLERWGVFDRQTSPDRIERERTPDAKYMQLLEESRNLKIKVEESEVSVTALRLEY